MCWYFCTFGSSSSKATGLHVPSGGRGIHHTCSGSVRCPNPEYTHYSGIAPFILPPPHPPTLQPSAHATASSASPQLLRSFCVFLVSRFQAQKGGDKKQQEDRTNGKKTRVWGLMAVHGGFWLVQDRGNVFVHKARVKISDWSFSGSRLNIAPGGCSN